MYTYWNFQFAIFKKFFFVKEGGLQGAEVILSGVQVQGICNHVLNKILGLSKFPNIEFEPHQHASKWQNWAFLKGNKFLVLYLTNIFSIIKKIYGDLLLGNVYFSEYNTDLD